MEELLKKKQIRVFLSRLLLAMLVIIFYKIVMNVSDVMVWLKSSTKVLIPFFYGFVIAYLLNIPCSALERRLNRLKYSPFQKRSRGISVFIIYALFISVVVLVINKGIPLLQKSILDFITNFNTYYNNAIMAIEQLPLEKFGLSDKLGEILPPQTAWKNVLERIGLKEVMGSLNAVLGVTSHIFSGFITIVSSVYFLLETHNVKFQMKRLMDLFLQEKTRNAALRYGTIINDSFKKFIVCQLLDSLILCTITTIEFTILGSRYSLALGVMLGICNIIPYFGSIFGSIGVVIIIACTSGINTGAIAGLVLLVTQQIDGNVIQPKLMGNSFSLSPALIVIGITVGGAIAGIWGMVLAVPVVHILKIIAGDVIAAREIKVREAHAEPVPVNVDPFPDDVSSGHRE
ncbi:Predicted PurR-regulated permease PerM [Lacrimispora sphenoides]|jgi:predicted PurR-regulated permease PerM|uniref:AI-2E family transporter n=1 Tax=Lacrimispora sphenoides TaxID=29370 RepID=UPI0008C4FFF3|nr:AI-2E family transporter [Lacrimispora sphenoides]SET53131.1 Predicted PurR-regulated permease PerM [Lacrimispora sphenoides]